MPNVTALMGVGLPQEAAKLLGGAYSAAVSAAGTSSQSAATLVECGLVSVTTAAANSGIRLPPASQGSITLVVNGGASTVTVYPATGEYINAGSVNAGVSVTNAKNGVFIPFGNRWAFGLFA